MVIRNVNNFRTEYHPAPHPFKIGHHSNILTIGSCFSDIIGSKLLADKFNVLVNPLGTVYNPISIFNLLQSEEIDPAKFVEVDGQFYHFDFHSQYTARDAKTLQTLLELRMKEIREFLAKTGVLIITLGTAYVYELNETGQVVANCHKIPQREFNKRLLNLDELYQSFEKLQSKLAKINPDLKYIFTVSPVRHLRDGIMENQLSKSLLRVYCEELLKNIQVSYFPAYELMVDDLRDYRFYKTDMIHPSEMAEIYIWEKFQLTFFSEETQKIINNWSKIKAAMTHRAFHPQSESHQKFLHKQLKKLEVFEEYFSVEEEKAYFEGQIL